LKDIYEIIDMVKLRPPMYIGDSQLTTLNAYLQGVHLALGINEINESPPFMEFHTWVRDKFELEPLSVGYRTTILEQCNGDEEKGLDMFFELVEEFKNQKHTD
jgi:hypothetical protein